MNKILNPTMVTKNSGPSVLELSFGTVLLNREKDPYYSSLNDSMHFEKWKSRDLSIFGKILIIKSLASSYHAYRITKILVFLFLHKPKQGLQGF